MSHKCISLPYRMWACSLLALLAVSVDVAADDDAGAGAARDHAIVQALLRLPPGSLAQFPQHRDAVDRYLRRIAGTDDYVRIAEQLQVFGQTDILRSMLTDTPLTNRNVGAARLLLRGGHIDLLRDVLENAPSDEARMAALALGSLGSQQAVHLLEALLDNQRASRPVRVAAATGLGKSNLGQRFLLKLAERNALAEDITFAVTDALLSSDNAQIRKEAAALLRHPPSADRQPLPPVRTLARQRGDARRGGEVFRTNGTCIKCHQVNGEGRTIGPDLSEIGSKLSREDMFVSILDPSAAISHNYETYSVLDQDGRVVTGLLINRTDDEVTIRDSEGIDHRVPVDDIVDMKRQPVSLMPADLQKSLSLQDLVDLVEYLTTLRKRGADEAQPAVQRRSPPPVIDRDDPEAEIETFEVADGITVTLFAAEPMIRNPTSIDVDAQGRVWVCEAVNYRHFRNPDSPVREQGDRIVVLEDTNGDGRADKSSVFYQSREIDSPHGVCVLGNRVIVSAGANVFVFVDEDGDLQADTKEILFTGIGGVQHDHGIHTFGIGPDGRLYFNFGNEGHQLKRPDGSPVIDLAGNIVQDNRKPYQQGMLFRCNLDGSELETLGWNFRNNWEVCVDSYGNLWQSDNDDDGNRGTRINFVMEYGNYGYRDELTGASWRAPRIGMHEEIPKRHWHLNDPGVVPNLLQTGAGSPTGIFFYEGDLLPPPFRNQLLHCDPGPNVVRAYPVEPDGAGFRASIRNLVKGTGDSWFRPVDVCPAPDGSLFVADWYDPGVGGHRMGDPEHGRLFRLVPSDHQGYQIPSLDLTTPEGAVQALCNPNRARQFLAQQALQRFGKTAIAALQKLRDTSTNPRWQARAAWQLAIISEHAEEQVAWALQQPDENLRMVGIRIARQHHLDTTPIIEQLVDDPSPQVRRELLIALRNNRSARAAELWAALAAQHDGKDRWYLEALGIAANGRWEEFLHAWLQQVSDWNTPAGRDIIWRSRSPATPSLLVKIIQQCETEEQQYRYFRALDFQSPDRRTAALQEMLSGN